MLGEPTSRVVKPFSLAVFAVIGAVAGWIADILVRDAVEQATQIVEWYREGLEDTNPMEKGSKRN